MRYDLLVQEALRRVVRLALIRAARTGLPGDHHFFIAINNRHEGVKLSDRLR
ncbi:MAG: ClpXP protease specificity-enhancing factor SspB, partial [Aestuariivirgaceae bacterium]